MKNNIKTIMAGTTTVLLGMNLFVTPVHAAVVGASQSEVASDKKGVEDQAVTPSTEEKSSIYGDTTAVKDENGNDTTIGEIAKNQNQHNALGIAGMFGVFSKKTIIGADFNSNVATKEYVNGNEFGTRGESHNLANKDISYIDKIDNIGANAFRTGNNVAVFGKDANITKNGNQVYFGNTRFDHLNASDFRKEDEINLNKKYIDIDAEFEKLSQKSDYFNKQKQTDGVKVESTNNSNCQIDVSNAIPDKNNAIYVNLDANLLKAAEPITVKGLLNIQKVDGLKGTPVIIINVQKRSAENELTSATQTKIMYGNDQPTPNESHAYPNNVLWNFGNDLTKLNVTSGYLMGSILAPNATVTASVNIDGNIVADTVNISGGENHHWGLHPGNSFIEVVPPSDPKSKKDNENKHEFGTITTYELLTYDLNKLKKHETGPSPSYDLPTFELKPHRPPFFPIFVVTPPEGENTPKNPATPDTPPETPEFTAPKSKTPLDDEDKPSGEYHGIVGTSNDKEFKEVFYEAKSKEELPANSINKDEKVEAEISRTNANVTATGKKGVNNTSTVTKAENKSQSLPETGEKQTHLILIGAVIAAAAIVVGMFSQMKRK